MAYTESSPDTHWVHPPPHVSNAPPPPPWPRPTRPRPPGCVDSADLPAEDGPAADQDAGRGHQEQRAAHGLPGPWGTLGADPGTHGHTQEIIVILWYISIYSTSRALYTHKICFKKVILWYIYIFYFYFHTLNKCLGQGFSAVLDPDMYLQLAILPFWSCWFNSDLVQS